MGKAPRKSVASRAARVAHTGRGKGGRGLGKGLGKARRAYATSGISPFGVIQHSALGGGGGDDDSNQQQHNYGSFTPSWSVSRNITANSEWLGTINSHTVVMLIKHVEEQKHDDDDEQQQQQHLAISGTFIRPTLANSVTEFQGTLSINGKLTISENNETFHLVHTDCWIKGTTANANVPVKFRFIK